MERLHDLITVWLVIIFVVVVSVALSVFVKAVVALTPDSVLLEAVWTFVPMLVLIRIAFPRIHLLCLQDSLCLTPTRTVKISRNQWNWQRDFLGNCYDHLLDSDKLENIGSYDVPLVLESNRYTRILLSRTDVLHSLGVPSLSVKLDSMPGRINSSVVEVSSLGMFRGSCYELCGRGHRVIPIYILSIY